MYKSEQREYRKTTRPLLTRRRGKGHTTKMYRRRYDRSCLIFKKLTEGSNDTI